MKINSFDEKKDHSDREDYSGIRRVELGLNPVPERSKERGSSKKISPCYGRDSTGSKGGIGG